MYPANLTGCLWHISTSTSQGFFGADRKKTVQPGLPGGRESKPSRTILESLENLSLKEGKANCHVSCRIAKDWPVRPFGHIWTKDQGGARALSYWCSESDRYARGSRPLLYGVGHEHCQTPEVHPCRNGPQSSMEQRRELRRAGRGKVLEIIQVAKSVVGFAALASLVLLFF